MMSDVARGGAAPADPASILIVDDDAGARETFEQILRIHGYGVRVAADAVEGLREAQRSTPAAVLLDLHLPLADGVEFLKQLRAIAPQTEMPITVVTGDYFVEDELAQQLQTLEAPVHFKPLWEEDLLKIIHDMLDDE